MTRHLPWFAAGLIALSLPAQAQTSGNKAKEEKAGNKTEARLQFHAAQAALYSALAHASALEHFSETEGGDMDMARSYVHTVNRDAQACDGLSVKVGQAEHSSEKLDSMRTLRTELTNAMRAIDEAQNAVDGHGSLALHAKNANAHLGKALVALLKLGDDIGAKPLRAPGALIVKEAQSR